MKFSVLLPTRNRLDLLYYAVETVRRQDYLDWEIIVSDNFSEEDIAGYIKSLDDSRIKYFRTDKFVPVTDNWNNALAKSNGDYVIMLGDDDCLMQGYFSKLKKIIEEHNDPDLIYTSAFQYAYPGVRPDFADGYLHSYVSREIFRNAHKPFWLEKLEAKELVNQSLNFRMGFDYNMQFFLVSRKLIVRMEKYGSFYQSPYPDYYAANAVMLKAESVLIVPQSLVTVGISPKSFGFYYFNDLESKGSELLKCLPDPDMKLRLQMIILPGTDLNTSWLFAMETLVKTFCKDINVSVNYDRYRYLQICAVYSSVLYGKNIPKTAIQSLRSKMTMLEQLIYGLPMSSLVAITLILPNRFHSLGARLIMRFTRAIPINFPQKTSDVIKGKFTTILDVFEKN
jgi:glycosyltransferase involved in cell wall biosynthesis